MTLCQRSICRPLWMEEGAQADRENAGQKISKTASAVTRGPKQTEMEEVVCFSTSHAPSSPPSQTHTLHNRPGQGTDWNRMYSCLTVSLSSFPACQIVAAKVYRTICLKMSVRHFARDLGGKALPLTWGSHQTDWRASTLCDPGSVGVTSTRLTC